ncbi:Response regulator receiver domain-containing protein [bacterium A37T11]|nr:Response regulator receiver domain-containing protein [bacterium A37T11]
MVVEDNKDIRELIEFVLVEEQYEVKTFERASSFWEGIKFSYPDLVFLDIMLPDGNGVEICEKLKSAKSTAQIPIILMSAHTYIDNRKCAADFMPKPFDIVDLIGRVRRMVG